MKTRLCNDDLSSFYYHLDSSTEQSIYVKFMQSNSKSMLTTVWLPTYRRKKIDFKEIYLMFPEKIVLIC